MRYDAGQAIWSLFDPRIFNHACYVHCTLVPNWCWMSVKSWLIYDRSPERPTCAQLITFRQSSLFVSCDRFYPIYLLICSPGKWIYYIRWMTEWPVKNIFNATSLFLYWLLSVYHVRGSNGAVKWLQDLQGLLKILYLLAFS